MAKSYSVRTPGTNGRFQQYSLNYVSHSSPRNAEGKLLLVSNPFQRHEEGETYTPHDPAIASPYPFVSNSYPTGSSSDLELRNRARAAFINQMNGRQGQGGLGMALATLTQTRGMVVTRMNKMTKVVTGMNKYYQLAPRKWVPRPNESWEQRRKRLIKNQKEMTAYEKGKSRSYHPALRDDRRRRELKTLGGTILEGMFGWGPLVSDINALLTIEKRSAPRSFISASVQDYEHFEQNPAPHPRGLGTTWICDTNRRLTYSGMVEVNNPNLYLANQLGLLNLAVVAWDRVPWSFLVGMFANVTQMLSSFTDFAGVSVGAFSETKTIRATGSFNDVKEAVAPGTGIVKYVPNPAGWPANIEVYIPPVYLRSKSTMAYWVRTKNRVLTTGPSKPTLEFRLPTPSLGLAAISLGLVLQKSL